MHQDRDVLMLAIKRFYGKDENVSRMVSVVSGAVDASLRMIEWFITNHAKRNDVILARGGNQLNVYHSYRTALKTFSKEQFDPFRRHERIRFVYGEGSEDAIETTVGQLNFFKWAIETGVLDYIVANTASIEEKMVESGAAKKRGSGRKGSAPPPADDPPTPGAFRQKFRTTLSFD